MAPIPKYPLRAHRKERLMTEATKKALATLVEIAENSNADLDTRIRAACSILDWAKFKER